jgi:hypothetical protein
MDTKQVGDRLVELCKEGRNMDAIEELYSPSITSVEAMPGDDAMPREMNGLDAIRGKNQWWLENHEIHSAEVAGPFPNDDRFAVQYRYDITPKAGPMAGNRFMMEEVALYTVKDGKIVREEFFYAT